MHRAGTLDKTMNSRTQVERFSLIRQFHLADWFTLGNAICGVAALFATLTFVQTTAVRHLYFACVLILAALIFDVLDGRIARWRQKSSPLGRELDSLSDVISFGVAPAVVGYAFGMQGLYDRVILAYFVACGVSRLARYNVTAESLGDATGKVRYFEGTPIPTSFAVVCLLAAATSLGALGENMWMGKLSLAGHVLHPLTLVFALSGSLMVSRIHIPKW
jgi:CDP-diacylglycerol--serine O-phosphatidyltransferase